MTVVTDKDVDTYSTAGFVILRSVLTAEKLRGFRRDLIKAVERHLWLQRLPLVKTLAEPRPFTQIFNLWVDAPDVRTMTFDARLGDIACQLMRAKSVRLIHDHALFKEPRDLRTVWHTDRHYWPISDCAACSIWIPLQDTDIEMGPISFSSGSHMLQFCDVQLSDTFHAPGRDEYFESFLANRGYRTVVSEFKLGDISVHNGWTFHGAGSNRSDRCRWAFVIHAMDGNALFSNPINSDQADHVREFGWHGVRPGEKLSIPSCPLIHVREHS
jgi:ectoine hydroxylase-related dioxygenase (phytanoyl-CoA dioxygenase family)